jgi:DNA-binding protein H-NS
MLHGKHQLEMDLQKQRHDAEKRVQQNIIQTIVAAEESVAKDSIDNWERNEKGKMKLQASVL